MSTTGAPPPSARTTSVPWASPPAPSSTTDKPNQVGLIVECPSLEAFQESLQGQGAADAMKFDGVRPETLQMFVES